MQDYLAFFQDNHTQFPFNQIDFYFFLYHTSYEGQGPDNKRCEFL